MVSKKILAIIILAPLVVVVEYLVILFFTLPYSHLVKNEYQVFLLSLVGSAITLISLYRHLRKTKKSK